MDNGATHLESYTVAKQVFPDTAGPATTTQRRITVPGIGVGITRRHDEDAIVRSLARA